MSVKILKKVFEKFKTWRNQRKVTYIVGETDWEKVRKARNEYALPDELDELSKDEDGSVRVAVARNPKTTAATLDCLSKDPNHVVREEVALNKNTSEKTIVFLTEDKNKYVRLAAEKRLK